MNTIYTYNIIVNTGTIHTYAVVIGMIGYIPLLCFYKSLQYGEIGVLGPITNSSTVVTIFLSVLFLGETVTVIQGLAIVLIIVGVIMLGLNIRSLKSGVSGKGLMFALTAALLRGFIYFMFKVFTDLAGPIVTILFIEIGVMIACLIHMKFIKKKIKFTTIPITMKQVENKQILLQQ